MSNELYDIRLPDGSMVQWTAQQIADYEDDWQVNLCQEFMLPPVMIFLHRNP